MEIARIEVGRTTGICTRRGRIPARIVGASVLVSFTDPVWDKLIKTVAFRGKETRIAEFDGDVAVIPHEVIPEPGVALYFGIYGHDPDSDLQIPLIEVRLGTTEASTDADADPGAAPTLPIWAQLQKEIDEIKQQGPGPEGGGNVEPTEDDIPKVFFGAALPQTKDDTIMSFRYISKTMDISGYCKTKAQGNSSMSYPKKNQTVKLYKDAACTEKLKVNFKGWGEQNKFCFKANWIDLTHARNVVSARLWGDVVKSRANYEAIPELLRTSPNQGAVDGFPVKVYADGIYQGRYTLNIPKDAWMANMDDELDTHCILCGENYVSGCFRAEAKIDESDWTDEVHDTVPETIKTRWNEVIRFVMNSTDEEFVSNIGNYFDVESLIDYYLYGVIICNNDGFGKNQLFFTYDGQKWIASAYDVDNTFGLYLGGLLAVDFERTAYEDYKNGGGNLLYVRLEGLFVEAIKERYAELKNGALSLTNIINRFERFTDIVPAELVKEDYAETTADGMFTGIPLQGQSNIQQIRNYIAKRYAYVDNYIGNLGSTQDDTAIVWNLGYYVNGDNGELAASDSDAASDFIDLNGAEKILMFSTDKVNWMVNGSRFAFYDAEKNYISSINHYGNAWENRNVPDGAVYIRCTTHKDYTDYFCFVTDVYSADFVALPSYTFVSSKIPSADGIVDAGNVIGYFDESIAVSPGDAFYWYNAKEISYTGSATVYTDGALYGFDVNGNFAAALTALTDSGATKIYIIPDGIASVKVGAHNTAKELIYYKIV